MKRQLFITIAFGLLMFGFGWWMNDMNDFVRGVKEDSARLDGFFQNNNAIGILAEGVPFETTNQVDTVTRTFEDWSVKLIKEHESEFGSFRLDVCWSRGEKFVCRDFGITEDYRAFYILPDSMIDELFVLVEFWEHNGLVHLLYPDGEWVSLHGSQIAIDRDRNTLFTTAIGDGSQTVGRISLSSRLVEEKEWNNVPTPNPWDSGLEYYFPSNDAWLR
jgi:hypothetical protein